jgi:hypothetical protein
LAKNKNSVSAKATADKQEVAQLEKLAKDIKNLKLDKMTPIEAMMKLKEIQNKLVS